MSRFRYLGIAEEATYGTPVAAVEYIDIVSESVRPSQEFIFLETAGYRETREAIPGPFTISGDFDLVVNADNITKFLKWALGDVTTTVDDAAAPVAYKHEFTPANEIKSFTSEIHPGVGGYSRQVAGCIVTTLRLEAVARELLTSTISIVGSKPTRITESVTGRPTFSTVRPFVFFEGVVSGFVSADVEAVRWSYANAVAEDAFVLGSRFLPAIRLQGQTVEGDMDIAFVRWDEYERFYGAVGATEPGTEVGPVSLKLTFTGLSTGSTVVGFENYLLELDLPRIYLNTIEANFDRRERIVERLAFRATYDTTAGYICKVTVINKKSEP